jgi:glutathionylspermidine synthase
MRSRKALAKMPLQQAIESYHSLLTEELAAESNAQLEDQLRRRGLFFGERPLSTVLRPRFLTAEQYAFLKRRICLLLPAFDKAYRRALADDAFRRQFRLLEWEEELIRDDPGFADPSPVSRLDAFFVHERGGLRFTEYNAETPAAASYNDVLAGVFLGLPVMREFLRHYEVTPNPSRHNVLHALETAWRQWSGRRERPRIAILDWREVPTYSEFVITADYFREQGIECTIADPRETEYRDGRLYAEGFETDLVYKRVLISELVEWGGLDQPIVRAVRDRAVCMVNPFRCKILHKKASLAVLSDERNAELFTAGELEAIETHIPWTRIVEERRTSFHGREVELIPFLHENRQQMVLKPNDEYGGKGIVLGWEQDETEWEAAVQTALREPYIAQERILLPTEPYPSVIDGKLQIFDRIVDTAPFVFHGAYMDGCLTRLSTASLVNVTAGGGSSLATLVVERR